MRAREEPQGRRASLAEALGPLVVGERSGGRIEAWAWASFALFGSLLVMLFYMSQRQGGYGPVWVFRTGRTLWVLAALALIAVGLATSVLRRPLLQRRRGRAFLCLFLAIGIGSYPLVYPSSYEGRPSGVHFRLPVEGEWFVVWGGDSRNENLLAVLYPDRRWGLDLVREAASPLERGALPDGAWGSTLRSGAVDPRRPEAHLAWDEPVLAPAAGTVVRVEGGHPDLPGARPSGASPSSALGNHVVIEVAEREYLFLAHLREGSIQVALGDRVEVGRPLARVGASGRLGPTPAPHVALHLADSPEPGRGEGIPWRFHGYEADGQRVEHGSPRGGQRLRSLPLDGR